MSEGEFSVVEFYDDGTHAYVERWLDAEHAVKLASKLAQQQRDSVDRIIITDGGDFTVFEWTKGKGVTFK
jgi:hypothetical protein